MFMNTHFTDTENVSKIEHAAYIEKPLLAGIDATSRLITRSGRKEARDLRAGDQILSFDNGYQTIKFVHSFHMPLHSNALPIFIPAGAVGNLQEFVIPEKQVIMIENDLAEILFDDPFALVRAEDLVGHNGICRMIPHAEFEVVSLDFGSDEVIFGSNGELFYCPTSKSSCQNTDFRIDNQIYEVLEPHVVVQMTSQDSVLVG